MYSQATTKDEGKLYVTNLDTATSCLPHHRVCRARPTQIHVTMRSRGCRPAGFPESAPKEGDGDVSLDRGTMSTACVLAPQDERDRPLPQMLRRAEKVCPLHK